MNAQRQLLVDLKEEVRIIFIVSMTACCATTCCRIQSLTNHWNHWNHWLVNPDPFSHRLMHSRASMRNKSQENHLLHPVSHVESLYFMCDVYDEVICVLLHLHTCH